MHLLSLFGCYRLHLCIGDDFNIYLFGVDFNHQTATKQVGLLKFFRTSWPGGKWTAPPAFCPAGRLGGGCSLTRREWIEASPLPLLQVWSPQVYRGGKPFPARGWAGILPPAVACRGWLTAGVPTAVDAGPACGRAGILPPAAVYRGWPTAGAPAAVDAGPACGRAGILPPAAACRGWPTAGVVTAVDAGPACGRREYCLLLPLAADGPPQVRLPQVGLIPGHGQPVAALVFRVPLMPAHPDQPHLMKIQQRQ